MPWPESGIQTKRSREAEWRKQSSLPPSPYHKTFFGWWKKQKKEVISEGRFIDPGVERPEPVFQKELLRKRQAPERECECAALRQGEETQVDGWGLSTIYQGGYTAELESPCPVQWGTAPASCTGRCVQECRHWVNAFLIFQETPEN